MSIETATRPEIGSGTWVFDKAHTKVDFLAKHLMVTKVRGHFDNYDAKVEIGEDLRDSTIEVNFDASSITTGAADRDNHLRSGDFLDIENHPELSFVSTDIASQGDVWKVSGDLTIRGTTRPIVLDAAYEGSAIDPWGREHVGFSARGQFNREDWGLIWNAALEGGGWLVSKEVRIEIEGQLVRP